MATNDGYDPYPTGLTAEQVVEALTRAYNLSDGTFVKYFYGTDAPAAAKNGDIWENSTLQKNYQAYVADSGGTTYIVWLEI